jgi:hypothetical protein
MVIEFLLKNEEFIIRLGYFLTALIILSVIVNKGFFIPTEVTIIIFFILLIILMIGNVVAFTLLKRPEKIMYLIPFSLIITLIFSHYTFIRYIMVLYTTDSIIMSHVGAESILRGKILIKFPCFHIMNVLTYLYNSQLRKWMVQLLM